MHIERLDPAQLAELAGLRDLPHPLGDRVVPVVERLHDHERPSAAAMAATRSASAAFAVKGFSQSTCLPAASARSVHSA